MTAKVRTFPTYRGRRAGRVSKGSPGTWEILTTPTGEREPERATGNQRVQACWSHVHGQQERRVHDGGYRGAEGRRGKAGWASGSLSTPTVPEKLGNLTRGDPVEGSEKRKRVPGHGTVEGKGD
jgi:hypothetical protein